MSNKIIIESIDKAGQVVNVIRPEDEGKISLGTLLEYLAENKSLIDGLLLKTGSILFRGFDIPDREEFLKVKEVCAGAANFDYVDGNSPRTKLSSRVYTSTEYPQEYSIPLHSEMSYSSKWPRLLFFYCKTPAAEGGETPIADCRVILKELGSDIVDNFEKYGVKYTRYLNGPGGVGKSWTDTFENADKSAIEKYCQENNITFFWEGNSLFLSQLGLGVATHGVTGEKVWFNQANQFHPSSLPEEVYKGLKMLYSKKVHKFPQYAFYGNGEEIPEKHIKEITEVHYDCALKFPWEQGDVLMLDNMLMSHGRMPFKGERKIYVSMC